MSLYRKRLRKSRWINIRNSWSVSLITHYAEINNLEHENKNRRKTMMSRSPPDNSYQSTVTFSSCDLHPREPDVSFVISFFIGSYPILKSFLAGSFSGTFSTILFQPLDLVKTRLQSRVNTPVESPKNGMLGTVANIVQKENVFGLWKGMTPSITRVIPGVGLYFSSLHWLKHIFNLEEPLTALQAISLGITARSMSGALLIPITVVKTRFESGVYKYNSISEALRLIYKQEGVRGLSRGLVPTLLRDAPYSGLYLMFYTQLKSVATSTGATGDSPMPIHFGCGILAGVLASVVTQPPDVVKTKMQLYPNEFSGIYHATFLVYKKYGVLGYFKGIVPRMLRRTLMTTMAWTVYEQVTRQIGLK